MEILYAIGGLVIGLILGIWLGKLMSKSKAGASSKEVEQTVIISQLQEQKMELVKKQGDLDIQLRSAEGKAKEAEATLTAERESLSKQRLLINKGADDRIAAEREKMAEQKRLLDEAEKKLKESFTTLAGEVLKSTNDNFLRLASQQFENKRKDVDKTIQPLTDAIKEYRKQTSELKTTLDEQKGLISNLDKETGQLLDALKRPSVRGRWGEVTLKRLVELSGMSSYCDFTEQLTVEGEDGKLRPDMVIHLPNDRTLVIDAKTSADHYLKALETEDGDEQQRELKEFARTVKDRMRELGKKDYWKRFDRSPEFVIQFLPGESFFATALEHDHTLIEAGSAAGVMLSSPLTLMSLLLAVKQGWKEEALQENASKIAEQGKQLYDRLCTMTEHLENLGRSIANSMGHYNKLIGTVESRIVPTARRLNELDAATNKVIMPLERREISVRSITASELLPPNDNDRAGS